MQPYRKTSHSVYDIKYPMVWTTKFRKPVLYGEVAIRPRDLIREICKFVDAEIVKSHVSKDHLRILVSAPPHLSVTKLVQRLKGKTSRKFMSEYLGLAEQFWYQHLSAGSCFVTSSGNVTEDGIAQYIGMQDKIEQARHSDFSISDNA